MTNGAVRSAGMRHVTAILVVAAAALLMRVSWAQSYHALGPMFLLTAALCAWAGGVGPGLTAAVASLLAVGGLAALMGGPRDWGAIELFPLACLLPVVLMVGGLRAQRERARQALRDRDTRLKLVSDQIPGGLWSTDEELRFTSGFGSQSALLSGALGTSLQAHFQTQDETFAPLAAHRRALLGRAGEYELEWGGRTFQAHVEPLRNAAGRIIGVVGVAADITDRKLAEDAMRRAKQELEAAGKAKDRFLATLSHELRTPLTPVLTLASSLAERADLPAHVREDMEIIRRNAALEATLIDDLLDITRIERGKLQLDLQDVDAREVVRNAVEICRQDAAAKRVELRLEWRASRRFVRGDAARLQQVFWNLIKNAVKFTPEGGRVWVRAADLPGERLRVEVSDTGIGIEASVLPRIFDAFEQGTDGITRRYGGLGLGLAISKAMVDAHAGKLDATSAGVGRGACFGVELGTINAPAGNRDELAGPDGGAAATRELNILLVEDHADTAMVMKRLLDRAGHRVAMAGSLATARRMLEAGAVDLLISDVGLPDGSGLDLMRDVAVGRGVRGIALSGYGTEEDVRRSLAAGFVAHLTKPVPLATLREAIARAAAN